MSPACSTRSVSRRLRGKLLGDTAAVTALLDRLLHHAHILKCGPRSWRTKVHTSLPTHDVVKSTKTAAASCAPSVDSR